MPLMSTIPVFQQQARDRLSTRGARITKARCAVLAALLAADRPLSHHDLERQLEDLCDRVTLYRVLAWLVEEKLAHRVSGENRVWRFNADHSSDHGHGHAHFHCNGCGAVFCMEAKARVPAVPDGFQLEAAELILRGLCRECS